LAALWTRTTTKNGQYANEKQGNNRAVQAINGRKIFNSYNKLIVDPNGAATLAVAATSALVAAYLF